MVSTAILDLPKANYQQIVQYLLPNRSQHEEAAFVFARADESGVFKPVEAYLVPPTGFVHRSPYFLELTDETRQAIIKRAHDLSSSVIEIHSHPLQIRAEFSDSDRRGFYEFVPHMLWRLKKRPYGAIVVTKTTFDSLAWFGAVESPVPLAIRLDGTAILQPTALTHGSWDQAGKDDQDE
jgi:hypothetical protein